MCSWSNNCAYFSARHPHLFHGIGTLLCEDDERAEQQRRVRTATVDDDVPQEENVVPPPSSSHDEEGGGLLPQQQCDVPEEEGGVPPPSSSHDEGDSSPPLPQRDVPQEDNAPPQCDVSQERSGDGGDDRGDDNSNVYRGGEFSGDDSDDEEVIHRQRLAQKRSKVPSLLSRGSQLQSLVGGSNVKRSASEHLIQGAGAQPMVVGGESSPALLEPQAAAGGEMRLHGRREYEYSSRKPRLARPSGHDLNAAMLMRSQETMRNLHNQHTREEKRLICARPDSTLGRAARRRIARERRNAWMRGEGHREGMVVVPSVWREIQEDDDRVRHGKRGRRFPRFEPARTPSCIDSRATADSAESQLRWAMSKAYDERVRVAKEEGQPPPPRKSFGIRRRHSSPLLRVHFDRDERRRQQQIARQKLLYQQHAASACALANKLASMSGAYKMREAIAAGDCESALDAACRMVQGIWRVRLARRKRRMSQAQVCAIGALIDGDEDKKTECDDDDDGSGGGSFSAASYSAESTNDSGLDDDSDWGQVDDASGLSSSSNSSGGSESSSNSDSNGDSGSNSERDPLVGGDKDLKGRKSGRKRPLRRKKARRRGRRGDFEFEFEDEETIAIKRPMDAATLATILDHQAEIIARGDHRADIAGIPRSLWPARPRWYRRMRRVRRCKSFHLTGLDTFHLVRDLQDYFDPKHTAVVDASSSSSEGSDEEPATIVPATGKRLAMSRRARTMREDPFSDMNLLKRESLKFNKRIRWVLLEFWHVVDADGNHELDEDEYLELSIRLQRAVQPTFVPERALAVAREDWEIDRQGYVFLNHNRFFLCMFQIADTWVEQIEAKQYYAFLYSLLVRLTKVFDDGVRRWRDWKPPEVTPPPSVASVHEEVPPPPSPEKIPPKRAAAVVKKAHERRQKRFELRRRKRPVDRPCYSTAIGSGGRRLHPLLRSLWASAGLDEEQTPLDDDRPCTADVMTRNAPLLSPIVAESSSRRAPAVEEEDNGESPDSAAALLADIYRACESYGMSHAETQHAVALASGDAALVDVSLASDELEATDALHRQVSGGHLRSNDDDVVGSFSYDSLPAPWRAQSAPRLQVPPNASCSTNSAPVGWSPNRLRAGTRLPAAPQAFLSQFGPPQHTRLGPSAIGDKPNSATTAGSHGALAHQDARVIRQLEAVAALDDDDHASWFLLHNKTRRPPFRRAAPVPRRQECSDDEKGGTRRKDLSERFGEYYNATHREADSWWGFEHRGELSAADLGQEDTTAACRRQNREQMPHASPEIIVAEPFRKKKKKKKKLKAKKKAAKKKN